MSGDASSADRAARLRAAVKRLGNVQGAPEAEVREALTAQLAGEGIADVTEAELQFLVDLARTSPRRAGWRLVGRQLGLIVRTLKEVHETLSLDAQPRWTHTPKNVPGVPPDLEPDDVSSIDDDLSAEQLTAGRETVARLIAEIHDQSTDEDPEQVRPVDCWLSLEDDDVVLLRIGTNEIARVTGQLVRPIRASIERWGSRSGTIRADCNLYGATPETAHLTYWVSTPA